MPHPVPPDPELAKVDDETLRVKHESVTAAIARAKASGGDSPPSVYAHQARIGAEIARRQAALRPPSPLGAADGAKEGDEIDYTRPDPDTGAPIAARGEVTEVHPDHYRVADARDHVERTVPKQSSPEVKGGQRGHANGGCERNR